MNRALASFTRRCSLAGVLYAPADLANARFFANSPLTYACVAAVIYLGPDELDGWAGQL